ncbi:MAG TPA: pyridoxal-phosphate dependent enzyme [Phycisphaerae bacterium]|nr:pyridoxal-phosphate dependent enzyme [Phycisphaerae bacterium]
MVTQPQHEPRYPVLPLFERFGRLRDRVPHVPLGEWPTPVVEAPNFARAHGLDSLHVKREDLSHAACGGNKVRGLEFLLAHARSLDAKSLLVFGPAGSHHVSRTAFHAKKFHMRTTAVIIDQPMADYVRANLASGIHAGVQYVRANYLTLLPKLMQWRSRLSSGDHGPCAYVPAGGSTPLSCLGHVNAALELRRQIDSGILPPPDFIYVALGSLGTAAGLALGCQIAGLDARVVGVVASYKWYCTRGRWRRLSNRTLRFMRRRDKAVPHLPVHSKGIFVIRSARGKRYAVPTESGTRLAKEMQTLEALDMDGTYTGKTLDGMIQFIKKQKVQNKRHLFWHTFDRLPQTKLAGAQIPEVLKDYFQIENVELRT